MTCRPTSATLATLLVLSALGATACSREPAVERPASEPAGPVAEVPKPHTTPAAQGLELALDAAQAIQHEWDTAATSGGPGFTTFKCEFEVPEPPAYTGQSVFLWCGVQQASGVTPTGDTSFGVLQPVLMFGPDCIQDLPEGQGFGPGNDPSYDQSPYWYYSSQYVYPNPRGSTDYTCTSAQVFKASPGDTLTSIFTYDPSSGTMTVEITSASGTGTSTLTVANPWDDATQAWSQFIGGDQIVLEAAVETWSLTQPSQWPPALLSGWTTTATVAPPAGGTLSSSQWQLAPWNNGSLSVTCDHEDANLESTCTWKQ